MKMKSAEERRAALRKRVQNNIANKDKGGDFAGRGVLDLSGYSVDWYKEDEFGIPLDKDKTLYECQIDIIGYIVRSQNHPDGMEPGLEDYILDFFRHRGIGPMNQEFVCMYRTYGKPCFVCEERQRLIDEGYAWDSDEVKDLNAVRRAVYNVIDVNDPDEKIRIFATTHAYFEKLLVKEVELSAEEMLSFCDLHSGKTIKFRAEKHKFGKGHYFKYSNFEFLDRQPYPEDILQETYPLDEMLILPTYEEVQRAQLHLTDDESANKERPTSTAPSRQQESAPLQQQERKSKWHRDREPTPEQKPEPPKQESPRRAARTETRQAAEEAPSSPESEQRPPETQSGKCPHEHTYGVDTDKYPNDCADCDIWSDCDDEKERLSKAAAPMLAPKAETRRRKG